MNFRLTAVFFGVVFAALAGLLAVVLTADPKADPTQAGGTLFDALAKDGLKERDIDTVELARTQPAAGTLVFTKAGDKWKLDAPAGVRVDSAAVADVVRAVANARPTAYPELTDNRSTSGLAPAPVTVTLKSGPRALTVDIGTTTLGASKAVTFVATSANPDRVIAVAKTDLDALFKPDPSKPAAAVVKWLPDFRQKKLFAPDLRDPATEATGLTLAAGGKSFTLARTPAAGWAFTSPADFGPADDAGDPAAQPGAAPLTGVRPLLTALAGLQAATGDDFLDAPGDLAQYGLAPADPAAVRVELVTPGGPAGVTIGKPVVVDGKPVVPARVYAQAAGDAAVAQVAFDRVEALKATAANPGEMRVRDLLPPAQKDEIDALDLVVGPNTVKLRKVPVAGSSASQWAVYGGPAGPVAARAADVTQLVDYLTRPRAGREVLAGPTDAAFAGPATQATVKVWAAGVDAKPDPKAAAGTYPPEPTLKGNPTEVILGKAEADRVFTRRVADGKTTDFKAGDAVAPLAVKPRSSWIDPKFTGFDPAAATKLTFNRGAEPFELDKAAGAWTFAAPPALKGRPADGAKVDALLGQLAGLAAERVVAEAPTPDELKKLGLDPAGPRLRAAVTVTGDPAARVTEFGADTDDKQAVLVRQPARPAVARVGRAVFDQLTTADLRDPVVVKLDPATVTRVKLRGWKGLFGSPQTFTVERDGAGWKGVTTPPNLPANPDPAKVTALLALVAAPRADPFVGAPKPDYGLSPDANPDAVEITLERSAGPPVTLTLGAKADAAGKVFALASTAPAEAFQFNATPLKAYLDRPAGFQK